MTYVNGDIYEGEWIYGVKNGQGKFKYSNVDVYEGRFLIGKRCG